VQGGFSVFPKYKLKPPHSRCSGVAATSCSAAVFRLPAIRSCAAPLVITFAVPPSAGGGGLSSPTHTRSESQERAPPALTILHRVVSRNGQHCIRAVFAVVRPSTLPLTRYCTCCYAAVELCSGLTHVSSSVLPRPVRRPLHCI
jgi:hypothetical protein